MKRVLVSKIVLSLAAIIAMGIGVSLLFFPVEFEASAGVVLNDSSSLLSEIRAYGAMIFLGGLMMLAGVIYTKWTSLSLGLAAGLYLAIGMARLISFLMDGIPTENIVTSMLIEFLVGGVCLILFRKQAVKGTTLTLAKS